MTDQIKDGGPEEIDPVAVQCSCDEFENAIRKFGVVNACEWFGYDRHDNFTAGTIDCLKERTQADREKQA